MQCSICRTGHKPIPAAQDRGWNHINPGSLQNLNVAPRTGTLCPREYWSRRLRGSPWAAPKEILACLEGWRIHLQPVWRKSTLAPFMAGWAATAVVSKEGWKTKKQKPRELFLLTSSLLDLTASSSHVLLQRSGASNTETWVSAKDLVCYNYTEHSSIQNLHSKTVTKKLSKISDPHLHQNWSEFTAKTHMTVINLHWKYES